MIRAVTQVQEAEARGLANRVDQAQCKEAAPSAATEFTTTSAIEADLPATNDW